MELLIQKCSIVAAGRWNPNIFTPNWVAKNLFNKQDEETIDIEVLLSPLVSLKFVSDDVKLIPELQRLVVGINKNEDTILNDAETVMIKSLNLLEHTSISAIGINFGFKEYEASDLILDLFDLKDMFNLSEYEQTTIKSSISHSIDFDPWILNLSIELHDGKVNANLNFHLDINSASKAADELKGRFLQFRNDGVGLLENVYGMTLQSEDLEEPEEENED